MNRPRGLCWHCYHVPGVKELYPPTSKYARHGVPNYCGTRPWPTPTAAAPGTPEKLAELGRRAEAGEELWHPADAAVED